MFFYNFLIFLLAMKTTSSSTYILNVSGSQLCITETGQNIGNFTSLAQFVQIFQMQDLEMQLEIDGNMTINETVILYSNVSFYGGNTNSSSFIFGSSGQIQIISNISSNINFFLANFKIIQSISDLLIFPLLLINNISFVQISVYIL